MEELYKLEALACSWPEGPCYRNRNGQANGAILVRWGYRCATATVGKAQGRGGFFPLSCDYEENCTRWVKFPEVLLKGGKTDRKGNTYIKAYRQAHKTPFPEGISERCQVIATVLSVDRNNSPEIAAMIGSSAALSISSIPFDGPTGSVEVGLVDGQFILNPDIEQKERSDLSLIVSGTKDAVMMVEAGANEVPEETMLEAIMYGHEEVKRIVAFIEDIVSKVGKEKMEVELAQINPELEREVREYATSRLIDAILTPEKLERNANIDRVKEETLEYFAEKYPESETEISEVLYNITKEEVRRLILEEGKRPDDRTPEEIRPIACEVGLLPRTHGSGLFTRGQTQALTIATLGAMGDVQILDGLGLEEFKRFMHHYNFPPYSVGKQGS